MSASPDLSLKRPRPARAVISLVPMIDVMLILLVFFMVTSTYLNLDMIPALAQSDNEATPAPTTEAPGDGDKGQTILIRLGADGLPRVQGQSMSLSELSNLIRQRIGDAPQTQVVILPLGGARMQALVSVMEQATQAGAQRLRVVRLEARQ